MKKILLSALTGLMVLILHGGVFAAEVYNFSTRHFNNMIHNKAYTDGFHSDSLAEDLENGKQIISATLFLYELNNWKPEPSELFVSLLDFDFNKNGKFDDKDSGTDYNYYRSNFKRTMNDTDDGFTDFFAQTSVKPQYNSIQIYDEKFNDDIKRNITIDLNDYLSELNQYAAKGIFGLGFDPDCHFKMSGVTIRLQTGVLHNHAPEPATLLLFGAGLLGLASKMRKKSQIA